MNAEQTAIRLQETAAKCLTSLDAWNKNLKDEASRDTLLEAVHELRKVASRLEIDIAMNDRKAVNARPMPIPEHKSKTEKRTQKPLSEILPVADIREANRKRKIDIASADDIEDDNDQSMMNATAEDDDDDDFMVADESSSQPKDNNFQRNKHRRRPRQKREGQDNNHNATSNSGNEA